MENEVDNIQAIRTETRELAKSLMRADRQLPDNPTCRMLIAQAMRFGTSVGVHFREALSIPVGEVRERRMRICLKEADQAIYWLELLNESNIPKRELIAPVLEQAMQVYEKLAGLVTKKRW